MSIDNKQGGFIAIISSIIITAILMALMFSLSFSQFMGRFNILDSESKQRSYSMAEGCINIAILRLAITGGSYGGEESISKGDDSCDILAIDPPAAGQRLVKATSTINKTTTNLKATIDASNFSIIYLEEIPEF